MDVKFVTSKMAQKPIKVKIKPSPKGKTTKGEIINIINNF